MPEKRKHTKNEDLESKDLSSKGSESKSLKSKNLKSRESCWNIMNFFKLLEDMETKKISEKSGRNTCKGPIGSKIEYSYNIRINDPVRRKEVLGNSFFLKSKPKKKSRN